MLTILNTALLCVVAYLGYKIYETGQRYIYDGKRK